MEEKDMAREMLNEEMIDAVVGGAFKFYTYKGQGYCKVSDVSNPGTYECCEGKSIHDFLDMRAEAPGLDGDTYLQMAIDQGIFKP